MAYGVYKIREIVCEYCKTVVRKRMAAGYRYCSPRCARKAHGETLKKRVIVSCAQCGKDVEKTILRASTRKWLFCSRACINAFQKRRVEFKCVVCQKPFLVGKLCADSVDTKHCSNACKWKNSRTSVRPGTSYKSRNIVCKGCGVHICKRMPEDRQYCSHKCFRRVASKCFRDKRTIECAYCHKTIVKKTAMKHYKHRFCGRNCANIFQSESEEAKQHMRRIREAQHKKQGPNGLELAGRRLLVEMGLIMSEDFNEQVLLKRFIVDVYIPSHNIAIEWDGDYWHGHPRYKTLDVTQQAVKKKDHAENKYLAACDYHLLRFWECDVHNNPTMVKRTIQVALKKTAKRKL